ncbi:DNA damage-inducible protein I [Klebsiella variicola]|uniref:DNA damage-inducible protein I n=1 Tax=Klebsiella pneumoniae complex TaxID=3390273 RepID=UPI0023AFBFFE|nr:DNA damage-inducible protein I [Klebsiella variicola]HBR6353142.1 DNA damage-inducible protein I [Klebsiella pneumoniae]MDE8368350.1 DNA damage-inducible protein I [Klebsiella variicola]HBR2024844.1 DNA damage-inducible protein I [Klebsiella variicola]HBR2064139.1 DNA damage-inducible protein I [Klebsiella variicola]HBU9200713.1 DNA damage-inducible protein I [Klebsiella variicola]
MKVELAIDITKKITIGVVSALQQERLKRHSCMSEDFYLVKFHTVADWLSAYFSEKEVQKWAEKILQKTWISADGWFY